MIYELQPETMQNLNDMLGSKVSDVIEFDFDDEVKYVEEKIDKSVEFPESKKSSGRIGRGNPFLSRYKFRTMKDVNRRIDKIK